MSNDHWLARIELAEARANAAEAERDRYREALEQANLALIEAQNPGIDMEAVKRQRAESRAAALAPNTEGEVNHERQEPTLQRLRPLGPRD